MEVDRYMEGQFENTLGRLVSAPKKAKPLPQDLLESLSESIRKRNFLVHSYFRERNDQWLTEDGRQQMIEELQSARDQFQVSDRMIENLFKPIMDRYGFTKETITNYLEERKERLCVMRDNQR